MILTNTTDGNKRFVLPHDVYCAASRRCACVATLPLGALRPTMLVLREGERLHVARAVLSVPEIARAIRRGRVRVEEMQG
jgi:hypothetical protein